MSGPKMKTEVYVGLTIVMGWLRLVCSFKLHVSFAEYSLFYRSRLQKRPVMLESLLIEATHMYRSESCIYRRMYLWTDGVYRGVKCILTKKQ